MTAATINALFQGLSFILFLLMVVGYVLAIFSLVHVKNRAHCQIGLLALLPVAIMACYLVGVPLYRLISGSTGADYVVLAIGISAALIVAGDTQERARVLAIVALAVVAGLLSVVAYALTTNPEGWLLRVAALRDSFGGGAVHGVAGAFLFGVLLILRARLYHLGQNREQRLESQIPANDPGGAFIGLTLILPGVMGLKLLFLAIDPELGLVNIYGAAVDLNTVLVNHLLAFAVGVLLAAVMTKGNFFVALFGGVAGIAAIAPAADAYSNSQAIFVSLLVVAAALLCRRLLIARGFDELIGGVCIHASAGCFGLLLCGWLLAGQELVAPDGALMMVSVLGQTVATVFLVLFMGWLPGLLCAWALNRIGLLRVPKRLELIGGDIYWNHGSEPSSRECLDMEAAEVNKERLARRDPNDGDNVGNPS